MRHGRLLAAWLVADGLALTGTRLATVAVPWLGSSRPSWSRRCWPGP